MTDPFPLLPPVDYPSDIESYELPPIFPTFSVPKLAEKPQDPIMDTLRFTQSAQRHLADPQLLPPEVIALTDLWISDSGNPQNIWAHAAAASPTNQSYIKSWDSLRASFVQLASPGPFLSEQSNRVFSSARYHVNPRIHDSQTYMIHASVAEVLKSIRMILIGTSSPLYAWDSESEKFMLTSGEPSKQGVLVIDGKDDIISESFMRRFLSIGSLLRRLERFTDTLRRQSTAISPTIHAFIHALSSCVEHTRLGLADFPDNTGDSMHDLNTPAATWMHHDEYEQILTALASLCRRDMDIYPPDYGDLPTSAETLLSDIYTALESHIERGSSRLVTAMFAYILTMTCQDYYRHLSRSVGYSRDFVVLNAHKSAASQDLNLDFGVMNDDEQDDAQTETDGTDAEFPCFMSSDIIEALIRARDSLKLLRAAQPEHPLLQGVSSYQELAWFWTDEDVQAAWTCREGSEPSTDQQHQEELFDGISDKYEPTASDQDVLSQFQVFNLEPGAHLVAPSSSSHLPKRHLEQFLSTFPKALPTITPTLPHLTSLVISPLLEHCYALSGALLTLFLSRSSYLNLHAHLSLLRSYLLLTSPIFKARLQGALFSDEDNWRFEGSETRALAKKSSLHRLRRVKTPSGDGPDSGWQTEEGTGPWAVGLGLGLAERDSWPPGGADLGFYLRTVIMDSLESLHGLGRFDNNEHAEDSDENKRIFVEAEYRLGFAIRDLPVGTGRERWLNPCSIESLDFLYMDYKPPHPLDVLITPDVLSKYQRVFSFILRLMRVQSASSTLFRMIRQTSNPLFSTLSSANKLLLRFRFMAQSFVEALSSYVFDTAIRGNFDAFLAQLDVSPTSSSASGRFSDVFVLADLHSSVLDDILSACLLRSGQRAAGDLLRGCLELVLDLCILAGELRRGRIEEYKAQPVLEDLFSSYSEKMTTLVEVLKMMIDKGSSSSHLPIEFAHLQGMTSGSPMAPGGTGSLRYLLAKLDAGGLKGG